MTKLEIGSLMAIGPFVSLFANPFWGFWSDKSRNIRIILMMMMGAPSCWPKRSFMRRPMPGFMEP